MWKEILFQSLTTSGSCLSKAHVFKPSQKNTEILPLCHSCLPTRPSHYLYQRSTTAAIGTVTVRHFKPSCPASANNIIQLTHFTHTPMFHCCCFCPSTRIVLPQWAPWIYHTDEVLQAGAPPTLSCLPTSPPKHWLHHDGPVYFQLEIIIHIMTL